MGSNKIRIAILAEDKPGFIKPMAEGLAKMLGNSGVDGHVFYQGLAQLDAKVSRRWSTRFKNTLKKIANRFSANQHYIIPTVTDKTQRDFLTALQGFDAVVVVCPLPRAFEKDSLSVIETVRQQLNIPVVLYQNYFLASRGPWYQEIVQANGAGLERFDWYLAASSVSEYPLAELDGGKQWPVSEVGHDLRADSLAENWGKDDWRAKSDRSFKVLLDFPRVGFEAERALQKEVLDHLEVPYTELSGRYSIAQIRELYAEHHVFMLSFRESFGLPIVENQLCGNWIFTPHEQWCPSHFLSQSNNLAQSDDADNLNPGNSSLGELNLGNLNLGKNFAVYDSDKQLAQQIDRCLAWHLDLDTQGYDYQRNRVSFSEQYPSLFSGNREAIDDFINRLSSDEINSQSHLKNAFFNQFIANC